jgi:hypothetical protein
MVLYMELEIFVLFYVGANSRIGILSISNKMEGLYLKVEI